MLIAECWLVVQELIQVVLLLLAVVAISSCCRHAQNLIICVSNFLATSYRVWLTILLPSNWRSDKHATVPCGAPIIGANSCRIWSFMSPLAYSGPITTSSLLFTWWVSGRKMISSHDFQFPSSHTSCLCEVVKHIAISTSCLRSHLIISHVVIIHVNWGCHHRWSSLLYLRR